MKNWWRITISFDGDESRERETYAFFGTRRQVVKMAKDQLGRWWNDCMGKVESVTKMSGPPYFQWRR